MTDREIDAKIAEQLFGWQWYRKISKNKTGEPAIGAGLFPPSEFNRLNAWPDFWEPVENPAVLALDWDQRGLSEDGHYGIPHYTTDARACALVKAELRRRGWHYNIQYDPEIGGYSAEIVDKRIDYTVYGYAWDDDSEERAVALAALRAVGVT